MIHYITIHYIMIHWTYDTLPVYLWFVDLDCVEVLRFELFWLGAIPFAELWKSCHFLPTDASLKGIGR